MDADTTSLEAPKKCALVACEGTRGYQPQMAFWTEQLSWVCGEFRDGNMPAAYQVRAFLKRAFAALPDTVTRRRLRADSALYEEEALTWADDVGIEFVVSADMSEALAAKLAAIPEYEWKSCRSLSEHAFKYEGRQWPEGGPGQELDFIPGWRCNHKKNGQALRYIVIWVRPRQKNLLHAEAAAWRHFAVVINMDWIGDRLLRWYREKQGTVEHALGILKGDLGGGVLPTGKFGANAAW